MVAVAEVVPSAVAAWTVTCGFAIVLAEGAKYNPGVVGEKLPEEAATGLTDMTDQVTV
jgi:hypothetical protein